MIVCVILLSKILSARYHNEIFTRVLLVLCDSNWRNHKHSRVIVRLSPFSTIKPNFDNLKKIADALNVSADELLKNKENTNV